MILRKMEDLVRRGASVNRSGSLQSAAANLGQEEDQPEQLLRTLVRLGGDVNHGDELGNTALHVAAAYQKPEIVACLCNTLGADRTLRNSDGKTPLQCLENNNKFDFFADVGLTSMPVRAVDVLPKLRCSTALMAREQRATLLDGWMSPRMRCVLSTTAELEAGGILRECEIRFEPYQPAPLSVCCDDCGIKRIDYIPRSVLECNRGGLYQSFKEGWGYCFQAIHGVLQRGQAPTVHRVQHYLEYVDRTIDQRKYGHFLGRGGRVKFAVDALINISRNVCVHGDDGWEYWMFQEDIEALPATPLDDAFDVARFMCINQGGGDGTMQGPYDSTGLWDDTDDSDEPSDLDEEDAKVLALGFRH